MVKTYKRPEMRKLGVADTFLTRSTSNPMMMHMTAVLEAPLVMTSGVFDVVCSCPGWTNHKKCWHSDKAIAVSEFEPEEETDSEDVGLEAELAKAELEIKQLRQVIGSIGLPDVQLNDIKRVARHYVQLWEQEDEQGV